jgi:hypothetical protein
MTRFCPSLPIHILAVFEVLKHILTIDPRVGCVTALRSSPLGWDIAPRSMGSVTVGCGWVNERDPWGERYTASECTGCREEVDPSREGSHYV